MDGRTIAGPRGARWREVLSGLKRAVRRKPKEAEEKNQ
jgi:hypothetical protein